MNQLLSPIDGATPRVDDFAELREGITTRLGELLPTAESEWDRVGLAMRAGLLSSGKRIRPMLLVLAGRGLGHDSPVLLDLGCAVEMVHGASLIFDDLPCMDNALLRRGRPTIHREFSEDVALLAGVALLTEAFRLVASIPALAAEERVRLIDKLAQASGMQGLVMGQYRDLHLNARLGSADAVATTNGLKTGALFEAALGMAAIVGETDERVSTELNRFAEALGQAFQLYDDLLDECGGDGKDAGQDRGKTMLATLLGAEAVRQRLDTQLASAERHLATVFGPEQPIHRFAQTLFARLRGAV